MRGLKEKIKALFTGRWRNTTQIMDAGQSLQLPAIDVVSILQSELESARHERDYWRDLFMERFESLGESKSPDADPVRRSRLSWKDLRSRLQDQSHIEKLNK